MQIACDAAAVQGASTGRLERARRQAPLARSRRRPCRVAGVSRVVRPPAGAPAPVRRRAAPRGAARRLERLELGLCGRGFGDETAATLAGAGPLPALRCARAAWRRVLKCAPTGQGVAGVPALTCGQAHAACPRRVPAREQLLCWAREDGGMLLLIAYTEPVVGSALRATTRRQCVNEKPVKFKSTLLHKRAIESSM